MSTSHITPNFAWAEAACHDGADVPLELQPNARRVATMLEKIRGWWGGPLIAISWYRTPWYNKRIGGASDSRHMQADAVDMRPAELGALPRLRALIEERLALGELPELGGLGIYTGWIHVDTRPHSGHVARWFGRAVGSEQ